MERARGERLVRGRGRFAADLQVPNSLWAAFVRSPHAHARIDAITVDAVKNRPGVVAAFTAADVMPDVAPLACYCDVTCTDGRSNQPAPWPILAHDRVRYVGEAVACVIGTTAQGAEDAARHVAVAYTVLPAFIDPTRPVEEPIWPDAPDNLCFECRSGDRDATDTLFAAASHVTCLDLRYPRIVVAPLETRSAIGRYDAESGRFHLRTACQGVHWVRRVLADSLRVTQDKLHVEMEDLGGGFGSRIFAYPEYAMVLWASRRLGRPVRWTCSRTEAFRTDTQGRDHYYHSELALGPDGRFLALRIADTTRLGAYLSQYAPYSQSGCGAPVQAGGYLFEALSVCTRGYFTNMTPVDAFRGTGRPEATYVLERLIDQAAFELGRDPADLRAQNLRGRTTEPVKLVTGQVIDGGQFRTNQDLCLLHADRAGFALREAESRRRKRLRGFGLANYLEANGSLGIARLTTGGPPAEAAAIRFGRDGHVTITVGTQSSGQDHATPLIRLAAVRLGLPRTGIVVVEGDSDALPLGGGTGGSRSTLAGLSALEALLNEVEQHAIVRCGLDWDTSPAAIVMEAGVLCDGCSGATTTFADLLCRHPGAFDLTRTCYFEHGSFANGCHACEVEVDPDSGAVDVVAYTAVDDFGRVIDSGNVRGQVQGGIVQGLGTALLEGCHHDPDSGRLLTGSFDTYLLPRASTVPPIRWIDNGLPSRVTPLGVKACGEAAISAAPPAVMNAVIDALRPCLGAETLQMPVMPEAVCRIAAGALTRAPVGESR